jgi:hypothetical protein
MLLDLQHSKPDHCSLHLLGQFTTCVAVLGLGEADSSSNHPTTEHWASAACKWGCAHLHHPSVPPQTLHPKPTMTCCYQNCCYQIHPFGAVSASHVLRAKSAYSYRQHGTVKLTACQQGSQCPALMFACIHVQAWSSQMRSRG